MTSRLKLLINNILIYGMSRVIVMLVPLVMLPMISRRMTDISFFGIASLVTTIVTLLTHLIILGSTDAAIRYAFDYNKLHHKIELYSTTMFIILGMNIIVLLSGYVFRVALSNLFFNSNQYTNLIIIGFVTASVNSLLFLFSTPTRVNNERRYFVISSIISTIATYTVAYILILKGNFLYALPFGSLSGIFLAFLIFFIKEFRKFKLNLFNIDLAKKILKMGFPLVFAYLSLWIYKSFDKILLTQLSNLHEVGIYSVGAKFATLASIIYIAFNTGWSYFSYHTMDDDDQIDLISNIFRFFIIIMLLTLLASVIVTRPLFNLLFVGDYTLGAFIAPLLLSAPFSQVLIQIVATQYLIKKNSKIYSLAQIIGVIINVALNYLLIINYGAIGAAFATSVSYLIPLVILFWIAKKNDKINIKSIEIFSYVFFIFIFYIAMYLLIINLISLSIVVSSMSIILIVILKIKSINKVLKYILRKFGKE